MQQKEENLSAGYMISELRNCLLYLLQRAAKGGQLCNLVLTFIILGYRCTFVPMPYTEIHSTYIVSCTDSQFSVVQVQFTLH